MEKCVRLETCPIGDAGFAILERMFDSYAHCKQMFLDRLSGIGSVLDVQNFISLRNRIRTEQNRISDHGKETGNKTYCETYGFQGRFWVQALKDASSTVKSMWKNVGAECRAKLRDNDAHRDMPKPERAYCNYVLGAPQVLYCILNQVPYEGKDLKEISGDPGRDPGRAPETDGLPTFPAPPAGAGQPAPSTGRAGQVHAPG